MRTSAAFKNLSLKPESFRIDRRRFLTYSGVFGVSSVFVNTDALLAAGECEKIDPETIPNDPELFADSTVLHYWIQGIHLNDQTDLKSRADIALFFTQKQKDDRFIERVVLTDANLKTLGARFYDASSQMSTGHLPYVIFNGVQLNYNEKYYVFYQVREGSDITLHKFTLEDARRSLLNKSFLPSSMLANFNKFLANHNGLMTSPLQYYTQNGVSTHSARGILRHIGTDNTMEMAIELMHDDPAGHGPDAAVPHYMRYFLITDPVGRLIGYYERTYQEAATAMINGNKAMVVNALTDETRRSLGLDPDQVALINDCPYIQIFTEDVYDALARNTIHLK